MIETDEAGIITEGEICRRIGRDKHDSFTLSDCWESAEAQHKVDIEIVTGAIPYGLFQGEDGTDILTVVLAALKAKNEREELPNSPKYYIDEPPVISQEAAQKLLKVTKRIRKIFAGYITIGHAGEMITGLELNEAIQQAESGKEVSSGKA